LTTAKWDELGAVLRAARKGRKLTLREVAEASGVSNPYVSQLETAKAHAPSPVILRKLAELYELNYLYLMKLAGYLPDGLRTIYIPSRLSLRVGPTAPEEEDLIVEYLRFIRSQQKRS
jgi:HTH-type transcriptional regulator, competence development regulator